MELVAVFVVGLFAGMLGSVSSGGGIITIPYLLLFGYSPIDVIGTTRVGSLAGGLATVYRFSRKNRIDWRRVRLLAVPSLLAGHIGPFLLPYIDAHVIILIIGLTLLIMGIWMLLARRFGLKKNHTHRSEKRVGYGLIFVAMLYAAMFGAGGGVMVINLLVVFFGMKLSKAASSGITIWIFGTAAASFVYLMNGHFLPEITVSLALGSLIGGIVGANYVSKKNSNWLRVVLGLVVVASGIKLLF